MADTDLWHDWTGKEFFELSTTIFGFIKISIELSVALSLLYAFAFLKKSDLKSSYFYFLFVGYFENFFIGLFWQIQRLVPFDSDSWLKYPVYFFQWYWACFPSFWTVILSINRSSAIVVPFSYIKLWNPTVTFLSIFFMHAFPFTVGLILYNKNDCLFDLYRTDCDAIRDFADLIITFINGFNNFLSFLIILIGIIIYRINTVKDGLKKDNRVEKLLLGQTFSFTFLNTIVFACYSVTYWNNGTLYFYITVTGNYIYLFHEYLPMLILFYASTVFRLNYLSCYGISKLCGAKMIKWDGTPVQPLNNF